MPKQGTARQKKFIQVFGATGDSHVARSEAGYAPTVPIGRIVTSKGYQNEVQAMQAALANRGVDYDRLAEVMEEGLEAEALDTRHKYLKTAGEWLGVEPSKKIEAQITNTNIDMPPGFIEAMFN